MPWQKMRQDFLSNLIVYFNCQVMKRIACFGDLNLSWEDKVSLNFTIC